jgi:FAD/FMN-containing dehydrogenase
MNRIVSLDPLRYSVTVEAGCILQTVQEAAEGADRLLPIDWGARGTATVGGAISTNGGGMNVLRYGNTREQVLGIEVVLPDGRIWNGLRSLRKDTSGYDLKQLFIGGEGTLGIVTQATLKLYSRPTTSQSMLMVLRSIEELPRLLQLARDTCSDDLQSFELLHGPILGRALRAQPNMAFPVSANEKWYVLLALAGRLPVDGKLEQLYEAVEEKGWIGEAVISQNGQQERDLWALRDEMMPFRHIRGQMLKWDASVPIDVIPEFLSKVEAAAAATDSRAQLVSFGHVGDGNLHTSIFFENVFDPEEVAEQAHRMLAAVDSIIWSLGGSICAEHGVGVEMTSRLYGQKQPIEIELMKRVKGLFDPSGLFNPGAGLN